MSVPLDVNAVIEAVKDKIAVLSVNVNSFIIAGSYPAAVRAYQYDENFLLKYNDIDIYFEAGESQLNGVCDHEYIIGIDGLTDADEFITNVTIEHGIVSGQNIELNFIQLADGNLHLDSLVNRLDINAIQIGFEVSLTSNRASLTRWFVPSEYQEFLMSRVLKISDISNELIFPAGALIRLLYKSQQLELQYEMPTRELLLENVGERCFGEKNKVKYDSLSSNLKAEILRYFNISQPIFWRRKQIWIYRFDFLNTESILELLSRVSVSIPRVRSHMIPAINERTIPTMYELMIPS